MNEIFSIRLKQLRKEKLKTQDEVAKYLNVTRATFSAYERCIAMPPFDKIKALANYFDVSVDYLTGSTNDRDEGTKLQENDIGESLTEMIEQLKNKYTDVKLDGVSLDDESRQMLIASLQSTVNVAKLLKKGTEK